MTPAELDLIAAAATDSDAFVTLFEQYRSLINAQIRQYHIRGFSQEDWLQEARIAMLKALKHYDGSRGSQFGAYYRLVLSSHIRSLLRHYLAQKRTADGTGRINAPENLEDLEPALSAHQVENDRILRAEFDQFLRRLSPLEGRAFRHLMGQGGAQPARSLQRAGERSRIKLVSFLAELHRP